MFAATTESIFLLLLNIKANKSACKSTKMIIQLILLGYAFNLAQSHRSAHRWAMHIGSWIGKMAKPSSLLHFSYAHPSSTNPPKHFQNKKQWTKSDRAKDSTRLFPYSSRGISGPHSVVNTLRRTLLTSQEAHRTILHHSIPTPCTNETPKKPYKSLPMHMCLLTWVVYTTLPQFVKKISLAIASMI